MTHLTSSQNTRLTCMLGLQCDTIIKIGVWAILCPYLTYATGLESGSQMYIYVACTKMKVDVIKREWCGRGKPFTSLFSPHFFHAPDLDQTHHFG